MNETVWNFYHTIIEILSRALGWQKDSIGSGNGLAPNRRQAIIWTNGDQFTDAFVRIQASILYMYKMLRHNTIMLLGISTKFDEYWSKSTTTPAHPLLMTHGISIIKSLLNTQWWWWIGSWLQLFHQHYRVVTRRATYTKSGGTWSVGINVYLKYIQLYHDDFKYINQQRTVVMQSFHVFFFVSLTSWNTNNRVAGQLKGFNTHVTSLR